MKTTRISMRREVIQVAIVAICIHICAMNAALATTAHGSWWNQAMSIGLALVASLRIWLWTQKPVLAPAPPTRPPA